MVNTANSSCFSRIKEVLTKFDWKLNGFVPRFLDHGLKGFEDVLISNFTSTPWNRNLSAMKSGWASKYAGRSTHSRCQLLSANLCAPSPSGQQGNRWNQDSGSLRVIFQSWLKWNLHHQWWWADYRIPVVRSPGLLLTIKLAKMEKLLRFNEHPTAYLS